MKAIQIKQYGGEEQLEMVEVPKPRAGAGQVVVRIVATSFNPVEPNRASGNMRQIFPLQFPFTPGGDFSGVVDSVGQGVTEFRVGDEVIGYSMAGGAYAEFIAIDAQKVALKPKRVDHIEAASLALVAQTAIQMLDRAGVRKGSTVLIHGAGGAVGSVIVQVAHQRGAIVAGAASARSLERVKGYGADRVLDYAAAPFENSVKDVDAVLDTVGGAVQQRSYAVVKQGGALVAINQPPSEEEAKNHHVKASMLVTETSTGSLRTVAAMIDAGTVKPFVGKVYPLSEVAQAWRDVQSKNIEGKTVFAVNG
ncbi:MAG TPA: NADP-dependent oxidoreductase [Bryobacteraceae bacterium]|nr:NADP-dependent oxidoreductase [Bryobacteraceae bacterium]